MPTIDRILQGPAFWPESESELYRPSDYRLSVKSVPLLRIDGVSRGQRGGSLPAVFSVFYTGAATFSFKQLLNCTHEAEWTLFQTYYFSENLETTEIELGPLNLQPGTLAT
jgi:hypothetical protein